MLSLSGLEDFIQFIAAFNFANIYTKIEVLFRDNFLNLNKEFNSIFRPISSEIKALAETKNQLKPIRTTEGASNQQQLDKLKKKVDGVVKREKIVLRSVKLVANYQYNTRYSRPLFLVCGLYSTCIIFIHGLAEVLKDKPEILDTGAIYSALIVLYILYFVLSELVKHIGTGPKHRQTKWAKYLYKFKRKLPGFKPTMWSSLVGSLILAVLSAACCLLNEKVEFYSYIPDAYINVFHWMSVFIPAFGFVITAIFSLAYYRLSKDYAIGKYEELYKEWEKALKMKADVDTTYKSFSIQMPGFTPKNTTQSPPDNQKQKNHQGPKQNKKQITGKRARGNRSPNKKP